MVVVVVAIILYQTINGKNERTNLTIEFDP